MEDAPCRGRLVPQHGPHRVVFNEGLIAKLILDISPDETYSINPDCLSNYGPRLYLADKRMGQGSDAVGAGD